MADNGFRPAPREKNVLDNAKLSLRAPNQKGKMASLIWGLYSNNPRLTVYTNDPDDTIDNGTIKAALDAPTFYAFLDLLSQAINSTAAFKEKIDCLNYTFPGGKRSETPSVVSSLIVGRDEDGTIYISVAAPRRPTVRFPFTNPEFHHFYHSNGNQYTKAEISTVYARAYLTMMTHLMTIAMGDNYVAPKPREDAAGGGNRGGYSGGKGGGGGSYGGNKGGQSRAPVEAEAEFDAAW